MNTILFDFHNQLLRRARDVRAAVEVDSPCLSWCQIDSVNGWCEGCMRSLDEIADWSAMSSVEKRQVWLSIEMRINGKNL